MKSLIQLPIATKFRWVTRSRCRETQTEASQRHSGFTVGRMPPQGNA